MMGTAGKENGTNGDGWSVDYLYPTQNPKFISMPYSEPKIYQQGWVCPKCGAVMSPRQMWCINCSGSNKTKTVGIDIQWEAKNE